MSQKSVKSNKRFNFGRFAIILAFSFAVMLIVFSVLGVQNRAVLNPKGPIAAEQLNLILISTGVLLAIAIPTLFLLYFFAWKYRDTNSKATYDPDTKNGKLFAFTIWAIPTIIMFIMVAILVPATHKLEPRKQIVSANKPLTIQVVAMRWKWVFIYPEQNLATVNYVQIPTDTPIIFELAADEAPMSSFWIPNLGGQLYAMTGHVNTLNLMAEEPGEYPGSSAEINGPGFAGMKFIAYADTKEGFDDWVKEVKSTQGVLDSNEYKKLLKPSENNKPTYYAIAQTDLFDSLLLKYTGAPGHSKMDHK